MKLDATVDALPEPLKPIINMLIEGRIKTLIVIAEDSDKNISDMYRLDMDGGKSNKYAVLGAIEALKRDFMRTHIESRIEYEPKDK